MRELGEIDLSYQQIVRSKTGNHSDAGGQRCPCVVSGYLPLFGDVETIRDSCDMP
jgi:hypothetical protein